MISKKIIILIGEIKVHGITQPYVINCRALCLLMLLEIIEHTDANVMCYIPAHDAQQPKYNDDSGIESSRAIPKNTISAKL